MDELREFLEADLFGATADPKFKEELRQTLLDFLQSRTDRGDNEGDDEWPDPNAGNEPDRRGDDDVDILIRENGELVVEYRDL